MDRTGTLAASACRAVMAMRMPQVAAELALHRASLYWQTVRML